MTQELRSSLERIRRDMKWPEDDLLLVIHAKQGQRTIITDFLESIGFKDNDGIEITPGKKE